MRRSVEETLRGDRRRRAPAAAGAQQGRPARRGGARGAAPASSRRGARERRHRRGAARSWASGSSASCAHTLRPVELLVPYADGGSLAELHELAGEVAREDTPEGVRVRALVPARLRGALRAASPSPPRRCERQRSSPLAGEHPALLAREQLVEVRLGDLVEVEPELAGELGDVPEHVAELLGHRRRGARRLTCAAVVADRLLGVLGDLAGLAGEPERGVGEPAPRAGTGRCGARGAGTRRAPWL